MSDTKRENKKSHYDKEGGGLATLFVSALRSAVLSLIISILLAAILSAAATFSSDPMSLVFPMSLAALYISAFLAGIFCMRKVREGALLSGLFSGGLFMLTYMFISLFFENEASAEYSFPISLLLHSLIILFSTLGSFAARKRATKRRKIKR